jgi:hypothetical protein
MRMLQGSFPLLLDKMPYEEQGKRKVILQLVVLLHNFKTRRVGMNQITNTFMSELSADANYFLDQLPDV